MEFHTFHLVHWPEGWTHQQVYKYEMELIEYAEALGYDGVWIAEHHFRNYGICPNIMSFAAFVAARTQRIKIGSGVTVLPFHNPVRAAEEAAMVDVLSGGRLMFGFGRGYQSSEFRGFNTALDEARPRTDEAVEILKLAWGEGAFSHRGQFWTFENITALPKPLQKPHPPLWTAAVSPETVGHYARKGVPFIADSAATFGRCQRAADEWRRVASESGHPTSGAPLAIQRGLVIAETEKEARALAEHARDFQKSLENINFQGAPVERTGEFAASYSYWKDRYIGRNQQVDANFMWDRQLVAGTPDRVREIIQRIEQMGFGIVLFTLGHVPHVTVEENRRRLKLFAEEVMPHFRKRAASAKAG